MRVKELTHTLTSVPPNTSVSEAARIMDRALIGSVLVEENGEITGIMTERDILRKVVAKSENPQTIRVKDIMTKSLITIDANEDAVLASRIMDEKRIRRLIVTENGKIVGKITANAISRNLKYLLARKSEEYVRPEY